MAESTAMENKASVPAAPRATMIEYRTQLATVEQKTQEEYDKTVITLSGGALGVTFAFLKDVLGAGAIKLTGVLMASWICWGLSVTAVLVSYFLSHLAIRSVIELVDKCLLSGDFDPLYADKPGGKFSTITSALNIIGGFLFFAGVILIAFFVYYNLELIHVEPTKPATL